MAGIWYRAGTVAVTNGSKKVVGTGTTWKSGTSKPDKGHTVWAPDGKAYELDYVESDSSLYLVTAYSGVTVSGAAYAIDISRSGTNSAFSRDLSAFVAYHQLQMDGWQQLLTGTGDVTLTAPDGTKLTVPSWEKIMNAGTGVVAQAKTEADRAKTEAQNAAASAASAGNAVVAAALPLPDVWAPLSDSLRLITGYGRDVLVGSDVVARMVNFSRSTTATYIGKDGTLKTAAANEPRFEKEGLLIEGQSSNVVKVSSNKVWVNGFSAGATLTLVDSTDPMTSALCPKILRVGSEGRYGIHLPSEVSSPATVGTVYSLTMRMRRLDAELGAISISGGSGVKNSQNAPAGVWTTRTITFTADVTTVWPTPPVGEYEYAYIQLEALPFASSYIPTNGAAVTRAADVCDIPQAELNYRPAYNGRGPMTVAINFDVIGLHTDSRVLVTAETSGGTVATHSLFAENSGAYSVSIGVRSIPATSTRVAKYIMDPSNNTVSVDGKSYVSYSGLTSAYQIRPNLSIGRRGVSNGNFLFGHVRNLRIYFAKLSDEQFKAVA